MNEIHQISKAMKNYFLILSGVLVFCFLQCSTKSETNIPLGGTIRMSNNFPDYEKMKYRLMKTDPVKYYFEHCNGCNEIDSTLWDSLFLQRKTKPFHHFKYNPVAAPYSPVDSISYLITSARKHNASYIVWVYKITPNTGDTTIVISPETAFNIMN